MSCANNRPRGAWTGLTFHSFASPCLSHNQTLPTPLNIVNYRINLLSGGKELPVELAHQIKGPPGYWLTSPTSVCALCKHWLHTVCPAGSSRPSLSSGGSQEGPPAAPGRAGHPPTTVITAEPPAWDPTQLSSSNVTPSRIPELLSSSPPPIHGSGMGPQ